jgi:hypothetical protein
MRVSYRHLAFSFRASAASRDRLTDESVNPGGEGGGGGLAVSSLAYSSGA